MNWFQAVVLVGLAAVWLWVLGRPLIMNVFNMARRDSVGHWNRKMSVLGEAPQKSLAHDGLPRFGNGRSAARHRRLQIFLALCIAVVVSAVLAVAFRGIFIWHHVLMDVLLIGYTLLAARAGAMEAERGSKVAYLGPTNQSGSMQIQAVADR